MLKFYSFEDIAAHGSCVRYVEEIIGTRVIAGRCAAVWRNGHNPNVAVERDRWYDHKDKIGGGLLQLCAIHQFDGNTQLAQNFLGEWLHLTPKNAVKKARWERYEQLISEGYKEVCRYNYTNEHGKIAHSTIRMENAAHEKQFLQCTPHTHYISDFTVKYLYNLPSVIESQEVWVVEGEKDADTLIRHGICATTNCGGAKNWHKTYTTALKGKDIVICRDNDEAGRSHAQTVVKELFGNAKSVRCICPSKQPKGDATDYLAGEGTIEQLKEMARQAAEVTTEDMLLTQDELALSVAKEANKTSFSNYETVSKPTQKGTIRELAIAKPINSILSDLYARFLNFPRRIGTDQLFDHDRDTNQIVLIRNVHDLMAWIGRKSQQAIDWRAIPASVTQPQLYSGVLQTCQAYDSFSSVPDFPPRPNCYYTYRNAIHSTDDCRYLKKFLSYFCPADKASAIALRTFVAAPIYNRPGIQRPCWVIDSKSGVGVGKTTLVELVARLYDCAPMQTTTHEINNKYDELIKRILSPSSRNARLLIIDNVCGTFGGQQFAQMTTTQTFSGRRAYGAGEEFRPNDITFCITANNAQFDNDVASRTYILYLTRPKFSNEQSWKAEVITYIDQNRYNILGDIVGLLRNGALFKSRTYTRCPEFEREVMQPMCFTIDDYQTCINSILMMRNEANVEEERANQARELIEAKIADIVCDSTKVANGVFFLRNDTLRLWLKDLHLNAQDLRNYALNGFLKCIDPDVKRYPGSNRKLDTGSVIYRSGGIMWIGEHAAMGKIWLDNTWCIPVTILGAKDAVHVQNVGIIYDAVIAKNLLAKADASVSAAETDKHEELPF